MLVKTNDNAILLVEISNSAGVEKRWQAEDEGDPEYFDTLHPTDQLQAGADVDDDTLLMLWGDVSINARHPKLINF